jgi:hypothetical protein
MLHFASCVPNIGSWQDRTIDGAISVPKGPGVGIGDLKEALQETEVLPV